MSDQRLSGRLNGRRGLGAWAVLSLVLVGCLPAAILPGQAVAAEARSQNYTFAFRDADIAQVAEAVLGGALGLSYDVDPGVTGKMSFRIEDRLTSAQLLAAFEAALSAQDVVMLRDGGRIRLVARDRARSGAAVRAASARSSGGYELVAVPLSYATPSEVAHAFQAIGPANVVVHTDDRLGLILLGGTPREIQVAMQTIRLFDQSGLAGSRIRWFELQHAPVQAVAQDLERILTAGSSAGSVTAVPVRRLNGLILFSRTPELLNQAAEWIARLDVVSREEATTLWVYRPRNVTAEALAQTLSGVLSGTVQSRQTEVQNTPSQPGAASPAQVPSSSPPVVAQTTTSVASGEDAVRVGVDQGSNTLLVSAPASRWIEIQRILDEIDRTPGQVLIEASILEVTLNNDNRFGIDWQSIGDGGRFTATLSSADNGSVAGIFPGLSLTYVGNDARAAITALASQTNVEVVSAPKIVALDNHTASLQIGDQVPIAKQSARSTSTTDAPLVVTTEYRDTGVILSVTPRISGSDKVLVEISQQVSSVAQTTTSGIDSPTIQQRQFGSTLMIHDGETIALGGLISTTRGTRQSGVPGLQNLPAVGALFRGQSHDNRRTELIVLLTVHIVPETGGGQQVMDELLSSMREVAARGLVSQQ